MRLFVKAYFSLVIFALSNILLSCIKPEKEIKRAKLMLGTEIEIIAQGKDENQLEQAIEKAFKEIERLERKLSRFQPESMVSQVNKQAGLSPVLVDEEFFMLIQKSLEVCRESRRAFDITVLPVLLLWRFDEAEPSPPSADDVREKLKLVGCEKIILDPEKRTVFLKEPGMAIDLGGIAKGYAVDSAVLILRKNGVKTGLVNAGGDLRVFGGRGKGFAIGIRNPRAKDKIIAKVYLSEGALATSGDYERFYFFEGVRYSHIINPRTGYPVQGRASVSVKAVSGLEADAWATALFVLGAQEGLELLKAQRNLEALLIEESGSVTASDWFENNLLWVREN